MSTQGHRSSGGKEHDFQKFCVEHWADQYYAIEKEALGEGKTRPDLVLRLKEQNPKRYFRVYVEVQRKPNKNGWIIRKRKQYEHDCLIVIVVEEFENVPRLEVMDLIAGVMERDTMRPPAKKPDAVPKPRNVSDPTRTTCPDCGNPVKRTQLENHLKYKCKRRLRR